MERRSARILHPSISFDPTTGELAELRLTIMVGYSNVIVRVVGVDRIAHFVKKISARSLDDFTRAKAIVRMNHTAIEVVDIVPLAQP
jgi:hypothetical protein